LSRFNLADFGWSSRGGGGGGDYDDENDVVRQASRLLSGGSARTKASRAAMSAVSAVCLPQLFSSRFV
jgi:hypothetical protein